MIGRKTLRNQVLHIPETKEMHPGAENIFVPTNHRLPNAGFPENSISHYEQKRTAARIRPAIIRE
jgi:hypothetical protein